MRELTYNNSRKSMLPKDYTKSSKFIERNYALIASVFASLGAFSIGTCIGWSSNAIHILSSETFPLTLENLTTRQVSWIVAVFALGATVSPLLVLKIWRFTGSKLFILMGSGFLLTSWILLTLYQGLVTILCARLLAGIATGCLHFLIPIYIQDIASSELRLTIDYIWHTLLAAGIFTEFIAVFLNKMQLINIISGVAPLLLMVGFLFMPESPRYLCLKGQSNAAKDILRKFREIGEEADQDVHLWSRKKGESFTFASLVKGSSSLRRLLPTLGLIIFDQLVGVWGAFFYLSWIFRISGGDLSPEVTCILVAALLLVSISLPKMLGISLNEKCTLVWTAILQAVSLLTSGFYLHYKGSYGVSEEYNYIPLTCYGLHVVLYGMGLCRISWKSIRTLIPRTKYFTAYALCTSISWGLLTIFLRVYPRFIELVGIGWLFWFMALSSLGFVILTCVFIPDLDTLSSKYIFDEDDSVHQDSDQTSNSGEV